MRTIPKAAQRDAAHLHETILQMGRRRSLRDPIFSTCEALKLTPPQFHTLMWLGHDGPLAMGELSRRIGMSVKTMTGVVDRLERGGFAQRVRDEQDRRIVRVRLSRKGTGMFRRLHRQMQEKLGLLLSLLDDEDRTSLVRIFDRLHDRFAQLAAAGAVEEAA